MYDIMNLVFKISKENVTFHGYRRARSKVNLVTFDRKDSKIQNLEEQLYEITGADKENHVLFEVEVNEYKLALQFTDNEMWLGLGVEKQRW